jgi:hypothetical protein
MKLGLVLLAGCSLLMAKDKLPSGEIRDRRALTQVQSFCVDTAGLSPFDRRLVNDFLKSESKPKHLLTKLPWKLVPECKEGASDATVKVEFVQLRVVYSRTDGRRDQGADKPYSVIAALEVVGTDSQESVYKMQARAVMVGVGTAEADRQGPIDHTNVVIEQRDALYHAFWYLVEDLRQIKRTSTP